MQLMVTKKITSLALSLIFIALFSFLVETNVIIVLEEENSSRLDMKFQDYVVKYSKNYPSVQQQRFRQLIFYSKVQKLRQKVKKCKSCGITKFSDWTEDQLSLFIGKLKPMKVIQTVKYPFSLRSQIWIEKINFADSSSKGAAKKSIQLPKVFDWRNHKVVTPTRDQGDCGNCWAHSATAFFESQSIRRGQAKITIDLSQQFPFQCDVNSNGCDGGALQSSMDVILSNGFPEESQFPLKVDFVYPELCKTQHPFKYPHSRRVSKINITDNQIIEFLVQRPLNIVVDATGWQDYDPKAESRTHECSLQSSKPVELNHAVVLVGFTQTQWIIKNSWGSNWGDKGFIYITRNLSKNCGVGREIHSLNFDLPNIQINSTIPIVPIVPIVPVNPIKPIEPVDPVVKPTNTTNQTDPTNENSQKQNPLNPINPIPVIPEQLNGSVKCQIQSCNKCDQSGDYCINCTSGNILNDYDGLCYSQSSYFQNDNNNTDNGQYAYTVQDPTFLPTCKDSQCNECYMTHQNEQSCQQCNEGYGINQTTKICEQSPIDGCNYFELKRKITICYECHTGYELAGWNKCQFAETTNNSTSSN